MTQRFFFGLLAVITLVGCTSSRTNSVSKFVLSTQFDSSLPAGETQKAVVLLPDTIEVQDPIKAYSMGIQRYAAGLLFVHQYLPEDKVILKGIKIVREDGTPITELTTQAQRDSIIMDFLKFARKSTIPYYEHVKLFETDMMGVR